MVKNILISTASKISSEPAARQGFGVLNAAAALKRAMGETHRLENQLVPKLETSQVHFYFHDDQAENVSIAGDFNWWKPVSLTRRSDRIWEGNIGRPVSGRYRYKFLVDKTRWSEDPSHGLKIEDEFGGFNSILVIP
jgi:1,4-alpha-glucan branching enzyme